MILFSVTLICLFCLLTQISSPLFFLPFSFYFVPSVYPSCCFSFRAIEVGLTVWEGNNPQTLSIWLSELVNVAHARTHTIRTLLCTCMVCHCVFWGYILGTYGRPAHSSMRSEYTYGLRVVRMMSSEYMKRRLTDWGLADSLLKRWGNDETHVTHNKSAKCKTQFILENPSDTKHWRDNNPVLSSFLATFYLFIWASFLISQNKTVNSK